MPTINLPFNIQDGDDDDAGPVMGNFEAIVSPLNGSLEVGPNVLSAAPPSPITGKSSLPGVSTAALRSDAQWILQGVENLPDVPSSGNFLGRLVYLTAGTQIGKLMMCTSTAGVGTFVGVGNPAAADLVVHGAQHKDGGHDPLPDNTISDHMFAAKGTIFSATLGSDHASISGSGWSNIVDLTTVTTSGLQTLGVYVSLVMSNTTGTSRNAAIRVQDLSGVVGPPVATSTIYRSDAVEISANFVQTQVNAFFYYTTPATGLRTLRVQAGCTTASAVDVKAPGAFNTEAALPPSIQAVIL